MRYYIDDANPFPFDIAAVADAHHEDIGLCPLPKHVVDHNTDNAGVSGFDMGRNDIRDNWVDDGGHVHVAHDWWNNSHPMKQCDDGYSWSDGYTDFIQIAPE
jgi:hypothetical protein